MRRALKVIGIIFIVACASSACRAQQTQTLSPALTPYLTQGPTPTITILDHPTQTFDPLAISRENVSQVTLLARLGKGTVEQVAWSPNGDFIAVAGSVGVYLYSAETLTELRFIDTGSCTRSVAFSPDGLFLASVSDVVQLWDITSGDLVRNLGEEETLYRVAFSPDGRIIAAGGRDVLHLWDVESGQLVATLSQPDTGDVISVAFSPDGKIVMAASNSATIWLWAVDNGQLLRTIKAPGEMLVAALSPDGHIIASGGNDSILRLWDTETGELLLAIDRSPYADEVNRELSQPGYAVFGSSDDTFASQNDLTSQLWDVKGGHALTEPTKEPYLTLSLSTMAFSPDGRVLAFGGWAGTLWLWDTENREFLNILQPDPKEVKSIAFGPDSHTLLTGGGDNTVDIWNVSTGELLHALSGHCDQFVSLDFSPDGNTLGTWSRGEVVQLWDVPSGRLVRSLHAGNVAFSPDGRIVAVGNVDSSVELWDITTGELVRTLEETGAPVFITDERTLWTASEAGVRLWNMSSGQLLRTIELQGILEAISPDGRILLTRSRYKETTVWLWDVESGQLLRTFAGPDWGHASFSPDGRAVAIAGSTLLELWDVQSGQLTRKFELDEAAQINSVSISPDGLMLASTWWFDQTVHIWDLESGQLLKVLEGHRGYITLIVFSPDGHKLASIGVDNTVRIWGLATP